MNDFDVEMLLPGLFHLVRTKGRRVGKPIDPELYGEYFDRMTQHPRLTGFSGHSGRTVLDRWVRTSIVKMGKRGRAHTGEKMTYLYPTTMLSYKVRCAEDSRDQILSNYRSKPRRQRFSKHLL